MKSGILYFVEPYRVEVRERELAPPAPGEILVRSVVSAISAGTERLFYTGRQPRSMPLDTAISGLSGSTEYPLSYGYALAGKIIAVGSETDRALIGRKAFAFHPHASHALVRLSDAVILNDDTDLLDAVFFPNMETAVNLVMDGAPLIGERVAVFGLGVVGLLTGALLAGFPLAGLYGVDPAPERRLTASENGVDACFGDVAAARAAVGDAGVDLVYELSGNPAALDDALSLCGFGSRLCVGSWYGSKTHPVSLGGDFHRNRIRLFSSQVSTISPELTGRWTRERRAAAAWKEIERLKPDRFVSHRIPFSRAAEAYELIDSGSATVRQIVLEY